VIPRKPEALTVLSWAGGWGRALRAAVADPFTRATGIRIIQEVHVGLALPPGLSAALAFAQRPPVDVVWSNSGPALAMARAGFTAPLSPERCPSLAGLRARGRPPLPGWPFAYAYVVYYVLVYARRSFPAGPPSSWEVLLDPEHQGRVAMYPGGNGFYPLAQLLGGGRVEDIPGDMAPCWDYLARLGPQIGAEDYSIHMGERFRRGELTLAFRALTNALAFAEEGIDVGWTAPCEGLTDTLDALWLPSGLPENVRFWAEQFIDFALSAQVQQDWCRRLGAMPMHRDAAAGAVIAGHPRLPGDADDVRGVLGVPEEVKERHAGDWERRFSEVVEGSATAHPTARKRATTGELPW